jgi:hypothetical protein
MTTSEAGILNQSLIGIGIVQMKTLREKIAQMLGVRLDVASLCGFFYHNIHRRVPPWPSMHLGYYNTHIAHSCS